MPFQSYLPFAHQSMIASTKNVLRNLLPLLILTLAHSPFSYAATTPLPDAPQTLNYTLELSDAKNHYVQVTLEMAATGKQTELMMAVWTPGSYLVREYARHIDSLQVVDENGNSLEFSKSRKNRWLVETKSAKNISVSYRLYCNELSVRTNWLDRQFATLSGAATFITSPSRLDHPHLIRLKLPAGWTRSATPLHPTGDDPHTYLAENFDELVDSPIVAGNIDVFPFTVGNVEHQLVNVGDTGHWDGTKVTTDLKRMVAEHHKMWGVVPYDRYLFLNIICESRGGLEHDNSTMLMTSRWAFRDKKSYQDWLSLASHEFFHTWNVRRLRPKSLVQYDYENEVYTESLWIAEGITSYYEDLALVRSGLLNQKEYLDRVSANIASVQKANGRRIESLKDSSYDAWIKFYRPDENSSNTRTSYYAKGSVVAFLLDTKIRKLTKNRKSLDDVMQEMYQTFVKTGYTATDFRKTASKIAGKDLSVWFHDHVDSTTELDYSDIKFLGLYFPGVNEPSDQNESGLNETDSNETDSKEADLKEQAAQEPVAKKPEANPWLGIKTGGSDGRVTITGVESDSPATAAGLISDDELIAINGFRVSGSIDQRLKQFEIGDEIQLLISRRGELVELPIKIGTADSRDWKLKAIKNPTKRQQARLSRWLD